MIAALFNGDQDCVSAVIELESAVEAFNSALSHFGHHVGFQTFEVLQGIYR